MSYQALLDDGSGGLGIRVSIPGLPVEFVSDPSMVRTTNDGRRRVYCLPPMGEGFVFEERINIPEATADVSANRITLYETDDEDLGQLFHSMATTETYLQETAYVAGTQLSVLSESGFAAGDIVHLGTEAILIASVSSQTLHVQSRGYWDTVAQAHYSNDANVGGGQRVVSSAPNRLRGRRLNIYAYGEGDDPQGDGTQVWRGRVTSEPSLVDNGTTWTFNVDNVLAVLRNKIGNEMEAGVAPRGAYYHWAAPLVILFNENGTANSSPIKLIGFYETNDAFIAALQARVDSVTASLNSTYTVFAEPGDTWNISISVGGATTTANVYIHSPVDGGYISSVRWKDTTGAPTSDTLTAGQSYTIDWVNSAGEHYSTSGGMPRGFFGLPPENFETLNPNYCDETQQTAYPDSRIYLGAPVSRDWTAVQIKWPTALVGFGEGHTVDLYDVNDDNNSIKTRALRFTAGTAYGNGTLPEIKFGRTIAVGSLADFIAGLTRDAPTYANRLTLPAIWEDDFADILDIRAVLDAAAGTRRFLRERVFTVFSPTDVDKIISQHCRALGCYPCMDDDGRISFRRFEVPNASTVGFTPLDDEVWNDQLAELIPEEQGTYNTVSIKTGYSAIDDKHTGRTFEVRDYRAFADEQEQHSLEIAMQSTASAGDNVINADDAAAIAAPLLGYFSSPYSVVRGISVTWQLFPLRCGDVVSISSTYLPSFTGLRPMTEVVGIVVARRFALGEPFGTLDVIISPQNIAGYSPAAYVSTSAVSFVSGMTYDVTITTGRYAPDGYTEDEFFVTGDAVRLVQYDSESPTEYTGTVVSVNTTTHVARITFTGLLSSPGTSAWWLIFQSYSAISAAQRVYCVIAGNDGTIGSDASRARTYAA